MQWRLVVGVELMGVFQMLFFFFSTALEQISCLCRSKAVAWCGPREQKGVIVCVHNMPVGNCGFSMSAQIT